MPAPGASVSDNKFPQLDTKAKRKKRYDSAVINNDGVYIHVAHLLNHSSGGSDGIFDALAAETHKYSAQKRILTACPLTSNYFHVMRVIDRQPGGRELKYKNILANSVDSRYLTSTDPSAAASRTAEGYSIQCDIDDEVCKKWSVKIGKQSPTLAESMAQLIEADPSIRNDLRYPDCLMLHPESEDDEDDEDMGPMGPPTKKRKVI